jgi:hypothetical protein
MSQFLHLTVEPTENRDKPHALDVKAAKEEFKLSDHLYHPTHDFTAFIEKDARNQVSAAFNRR